MLNEVAEIVHTRGDVWTFYEDDESGLLTHIYDSPGRIGVRTAMTITREVLLQLVLAIQFANSAVDADDRLVAFPWRKTA